jgi:hypothetical protein
MHSRFRTSVLLVGLGALALLVVAAVPAAASGQAPAPTQSGQSAVAPAASTAGCAAQAPAAPEAPAASAATCSTQDQNDPVTGLFTAPIEQAPPPRLGFCRCGCGTTCITDADCGPGGRCGLHISCC